MSATIIAFPTRSPSTALIRPHTAALPFSAAWLATHAPLVEAGLQLCACDDPEFARRCTLMADEDGRGMLGELSLQLQRLGTHLSDIADALSLTSERICEAMIGPTPA